MYLQFFSTGIPNDKLKPFSANLVFYDTFEKSVYIICYFCNSKFGQLKQFSDNISLLNLKRSALALNSNGHGKTELLSYMFMEIVNMFKDQFPDALPSESCLNGFTTHHAPLKYLVSGMTKYSHKVFMSLSILQGALNILVVLSTEREQYNNLYHRWHLHVQFFVI